MIKKNEKRCQCYTNVTAGRRIYVGFLTVEHLIKRKLRRVLRKNWKHSAVQNVFGILPPSC